MRISLFLNGVQICSLNLIGDSLSDLHALSVANHLRCSLGYDFDDILCRVYSGRVLKLEKLLPSHER